MYCVKDLSQHLYAVALIASIVLLICKSLWIKASATCEYNFSSRISVKVSRDTHCVWWTAQTRPGWRRRGFWEETCDQTSARCCCWPPAGDRWRHSELESPLRRSVWAARGQRSRRGTRWLNQLLQVACPHQPSVLLHTPPPAAGKTEESYSRQLRDIIITRLIGRFDYDPLHSEIRYFCINYANCITFHVLYHSTLLLFSHKIISTQILHLNAYISCPFMYLFSFKS